nr:MAG TPA: hypothetical protein [Caudoviricetes sp.]
MVRSISFCCSWNFTRTRKMENQQSSLYEGASGYGNISQC